MPTFSPRISTTSKPPYHIELDNVSVAFGTLTVLKDISFQIGKGCFLYVIGPNGAGKSTLIKLLVGLLNPTGGDIKIQAGAIGYLPQTSEGKDHFPITVEEVIYTGFDRQYLKMTPNQKKDIAYWADVMDITPLLKKKMGNLSGGQKQRVLLIRALISRPELLILDEPASSLDPSFRRHFYELINRIHGEGTTIVYVTHDLAENMNPEHKVLYVDQEIRFFGSLHDYLEMNKEHHHEHL